MIIDEKKIFRYMDLGFYLIFVPIILLLIPTDRVVEIDPYFFVFLSFEMVATHYINRKYSPLTYLLEGDYKKSAMAFGATLAIAIIISQMEIHDIRLFNRTMINPEKAINMKVRTIWMVYFIDFSFMVMMGLILELFKQIKSRQNIEAERNKAEVALYRSQINPHFMLNTLNTLYGLYITKSDKTGEVFLKFSDMIKYTLSNSYKERVMVCDEVTYLREYIDLHTLRLGDKTTVKFLCEVDDESLMLPPMILITFVENAFKYGVSSANRSSIEISVELKNRNFTFRTSNAIFSNNHTSTSIGIKNCQKRLELLYPNNYTLTYGEDEDTQKFNTMLKIRL